MQTLTAWLPRVVEGAYLANLVEQMGYASASLARVGLELAPLLRPPLLAAALRLLEEGLSAATEHWRDSLAAHRWNATYASASAIAAIAPADGDAAKGAAAAGAVAAGAGAADGGRASGLAPPLATLQHPPVAVRPRPLGLHGLTYDLGEVDS